MATPSYHRNHLLATICTLITMSLLYNTSFYSSIASAKGKHHGLKPQSPKNENNHTKQPVIAEAPAAEVLLCVIITIKPVGTTPLKKIAHENTMQMYFKDLAPEVQAVVAWQDNILRDNNNNNNNSMVLQVNQHNTPLLQSLIHNVETACPPHVPFAAYANADILFEKGGLLRTLRAARTLKRLLIVGQRRNSQIDETHANLTQHNITRMESKLFQPNAQDYFIFSRGLFSDWKLPPFVIGRRAYDNAIVDWAFHNANLLDATQTIWALHQTTEDGNFAGHSTDNRDSEYNANLPGVQYDHGSTFHARYETIPCLTDQACVRDKDTGLLLRSEPQLWFTPEMRAALSRVPCNGVPEFCAAVLQPFASPAIAPGFLMEEQHRSRLFRNINQTRWIQQPAAINAAGDVTICATQEIIPSFGCRFAQGAPLPCAALLSKVVVITQYWGEGYFHTMIEGMPRLAQAIHDFPGFFEKEVVVVHASVGAASGNLAAILSMIPGIRLQYASGDIGAEQTLVAPPTPCGGHTVGRHNARLRALFHMNTLFLPQPQKTLILSRRGHGSPRSIINHEALLAAVKRTWKVIEHTGKEPVSAQLQMFAAAYAVMGPHGSGLANIIVMPEGRHVVEFLFVHGPEKPNFCYAMLAFTLGLHYYSYYEPAATWAGTWSVDIDKVMALPIFHGAAAR